MAYNYFTEQDNIVRAYCRITKNGISYDDAKYHFSFFKINKFKYDYGTKNDNLLSVINNLKPFDRLYTIRLNDLGYQVKDILYILSLLDDKYITLVVGIKEIDPRVAYKYISDHFDENYFINFNRYRLPIYKGDR